MNHSDLLGRRCFNPLAKDVYHGVIRAIYQSPSAKSGELRSDLRVLVERWDLPEDNPERGTLWTEDLAMLVLERVKVHVPSRPPIPPPDEDPAGPVTRPGLTGDMKRGCLPLLLLLLLVIALLLLP